MAVGPSLLTKAAITDRSLIGELEAKIDAWLMSSWKNDKEGYLLPFWVYWGQNHELFDAMLERYRATGWTHVGILVNGDNVSRLVFIR
jgi:hypothetical protein